MNKWLMCWRFPALLLSVSLSSAVALAFTEPKPQVAQSISEIEALRAENRSLKEKLELREMRLKFLENLCEAQEAANRKLEKANGILFSERNRAEQQVELLEGVVRKLTKEPAQN